MEKSSTENPDRFSNWVCRNIYFVYAFFIKMIHFFVYAVPTIEGTLVGALFSFCFLFRDFRFHRFYQLCELFLAFLSRLGIDILGYAFAVDSRCEPPLVEEVVYHGDASRATLAYLALVGLKFLLRRGFRGGVFTCLGWLRFGHFCVCTAYFSVVFTGV